MKCPACRSEHAYVGVIHVRCVNEHCRNYDAAHALEVTPKPKSEPVPDEYGQEYLWNIYDEMCGGD
jgi:hypothetical protein